MPATKQVNKTAEQDTGYGSTRIERGIYRVNYP